MNLNPAGNGNGKRDNDHNHNNDASSAYGQEARELDARPHLHPSGADADTTPALHLRGGVGSPTASDREDSIEHWREEVRRPSVDSYMTWVEHGQQRERDPRLRMHPSRHRHRHDISAPRVVRQCICIVASAPGPRVEAHSRVELKHSRTIQIQECIRLQLSLSLSHNLG